MNLDLDVTVADGYKSRSQIARRVTEHWGSANLYCPACPSERLLPFNINTPVMDYRCPICDARYQLKSQSQPFGRVVSNSAFEKKIKAIERGEVPHYAFLHYSQQLWQVVGLFVIPSYFMTPAVIQRRNPLGASARRAGWVGSNILLHALPHGARVEVIANGLVRDPQRVRQAWLEHSFLGEDRRARGGWGGDVLSCVNQLQKEGRYEFTLQEFYERYRGYLSSLHPKNANVEAKIRQQLQVLRDGGLIAFFRRGRYSILKHS